MTLLKFLSRLRFNSNDQVRLQHLTLNGLFKYNVFSFTLHDILHYIIIYIIDKYVCLYQGSEDIALYPRLKHSNIISILFIRVDKSLNHVANLIT